MKSMFKITLSLAFAVANVMAHGHMTVPEVRIPPGDRNVGLSLTRGPNSHMPCGGNPPGPTTARYSSGEMITIGWEIGAAHRGPCQIDLATHLDSNFDTLASWDCADVSGEFQTSVQLPEGVTCEQCALRFLWYAELTGETYVNCADISIE
ncbi:hypothetical protein K493DRAFT_338970 [Basidiobolus meristosporus CBS 931.73]|uniref:Chitin-binding type-4 domain-containing protein n=1 Tax=Basidiobolus meristosporus CBS 931.73 TaxID=1314790 RepID=A0A1Y1Y2A3_9FUNG|nr:hypothetical protein K493DRAFT_338970 [Basidiobolus meristosporus CBS 931.73]|eukprot:ORX92142.1 hypothetical protein K493DRAFT_338970 [Basidiobolus meristosporus CBS 931.73]